MIRTEIEKVFDVYINISQTTLSMFTSYVSIFRKSLFGATVSTCDINSFAEKRSIYHIYIWHEIRYQTLHFREKHIISLRSPFVITIHLSLFSRYKNSYLFTFCIFKYILIFFIFKRNSRLLFF